MSRATWVLETPSPFNFRSTAYSHGWVVLAPTSLNEEDESVTRMERLQDGKVVRIRTYAEDTTTSSGIRVEAWYAGRLGRKQREEIDSAIGRMFRIDEDLTEFYKLCAEYGDPWLRLINGSGRLLRSSSLFEDIVKTICTTNIQWAGTKSMVKNLVEGFGETYPLDPGHKSFPTPKAIAGASQEELAGARLGYRGPYILELSQRVEAGELDLQTLEDPNLPTEELRKRLLGIKGVGNYAAATLLMLLGRYEYLGFDTEMRDFVSTHYLNGKKPTEQEAFAIYDKWGRWKYLAYWFDNFPLENL